MFNFFKKKEVKKETPTGNPAEQLRSIYMGNAQIKEWPKDEKKEQPWAMFIDARNQVLKQNLKEAERIYRQIIETPGLESRHYMQVWLFMRYFVKAQPSAEVAKNVYGVSVEVCTSTGVMMIAGYADHTARSLHSSGGGAIWEKPDHSLNERIDALISAAQQAIISIPLTLVDIAPNPPRQADTVLICIFTPSGIYQGLGSGEFMSKDQFAGPILSAATALLQDLDGKSKK